MSVVLCLKSSACPLCFIVFVKFHVSAGILVFGEFCISYVFCVCVCMCMCVHVFCLHAVFLMLYEFCVSTVNCCAISRHT